MRVSLVRRSLLLVLVLVGGLSAVPAAEAAVKNYTLNISQTSGAGTQVTYKATFTVLTSQQQLGSANLTLPTGFTFVSASLQLGAAGTATPNGNIIELRNLALQPGATLDVTVTANISCTAVTDATWTVQAKQSNDFNSLQGNDLILDKASILSTPVTSVCSQPQALRFVNQPANASTTAAISPVSVEVVDGANRRVTTPVQVTVSLAPDTPGSLGGTLSVSTGSVGLAEFRDLTITTPGVYRLRASSAGLASVDSATFTVDTINIPCPVAGCTRTVQSGQSEIKLDVLAGGTAADVLRLSYGLVGAKLIDCKNPDGSDYVELTTDEVTFDITGDRAKVATYRIGKAAVGKVPNNGATFLQLCFGSPQQFTDRTGKLAGPQGTFDWNRDGKTDAAEVVYVGLLPDCSAVPPDSNPCISKRQKNQAGDGIIEAKLPKGFSGDPKMMG